MAKLLHVALCIIALSTGKVTALECYYCNDFDDKGPNCSTITRDSELHECPFVEGFKNYCVSFEGILVLSRDGILATRTLEKNGTLKRCLYWETALAPPFASCYRLKDVRHGVELDGLVLERVSESIIGRQCYCNQTDGCNYNTSDALNGSEYAREPYFGGVGGLQPMVALLLILPFPIIFKLIV